MVQTLMYVWAFLSAIQGVGLLLTAWRIYFRLKIGRFWWEDAWATILLLTGLCFIPTQWVFLLSDGSRSIIASWFFLMGYTSIVALARISVLFSIIRIIPGFSHLRRFSHACLVYFVSCWVILIIKKAVDCASDSAWHHRKVLVGRPFCRVKPFTCIFEFATDLIAVTILVVLPLRMLWRVRLPRRQKTMILSLFASSVFLAFGAIYHTIGEIVVSVNTTNTGIHVEVALSIIVCNLLVVVTHTYRVLHCGDNDSSKGTDSDTDDVDDFTMPRRRPATSTYTTAALPLTTIDLEARLTTQQPSTERSESMTPSI